jgi:hypothetical protein
MKRHVTQQVSWAMLATVVTAITLTTGSPVATASGPASGGPQILLVGDDHGGKNFKWANGTITSFNSSGNTFVLQDTQGKDKQEVNQTFTWNEKTTFEGVEKKVGERAKVKYTKSKDGTLLAHHVFVGKKAIKSHKEEKSQY